MFNRFNRFGNHFHFNQIKKYRPYISYTTWRMIRSGEEVNNEGTFTENLKMYSGNPMDFQGTQYIKTSVPLVSNTYLTINIGFSVNTASSGAYNYLIDSQERDYLIRTQSGKLYVYFNSTSYEIMPIEDSKYYNIIFEWNNNIFNVYSNGELVYTISITPVVFNGSTTTTFGSYWSSASNLLDGTFDYVIFYNGLLTQAQIQQSYTNPNQFYNAMVNDSNTLFCTDFRGNDGYIADGKNVIVGSELSTGAEAPYRVTIDGNTITANDLPGNAKYAFSDNSLEIGDTVIVDIDITSAETSKYRVFGSGISIAYFESDKVGKYLHIGTITSSNYHIEIRPDIVNGIDSITAIVSIKEISGVYPITNYSPTQRTNFQNESTGLQELLIERDSLGFFLGLRDYPKGNGVGYGDTGWIPSGIYTVECIITKDIVSITPTWTLGSYTDSNAKLRLNFIGDYVRLEVGSDAFSYSVAGQGDILYITVVVDETSGTYTLYINGIVENSRTNITFTQSIYSLALFARNLNGFNYFSESELRLFKVHNKILTQEEITINYNKYVTQGLLS